LPACGVVPDQSRLRKEHTRVGIGDSSVPSFLRNTVLALTPAPKYAMRPPAADDREHSELLKDELAY
jgi:hypothetical protein